MKNLFLIGVSIALAAACAAYALAQHVAYSAIQQKVSEIISVKKYVSTTFWRTGTIESVGYDYVLIRAERLDDPSSEGRVLRLEVDAQTQIMRQEFTQEAGVYTGIASLVPITARELTPGTPITALFDSAKAGRLKASIIYIGEAL